MSKADVSAALEDWQFVRTNTVEFIKSLGDASLKHVLPRPGLNTFCRHFQEMLSVQAAYVEGIRTGKIDFEMVGDNDSFDGLESAEALLAKIEEADAHLMDVVASVDPDLQIEWPGEGQKTLSSHLANLCIHETFHLGQLVAFCYVEKVTIPEYMIESWALSPQEL